MDETAGSPFGADIALLMATAGQMLVADDPMGKADEVWKLAEEVIGRHGAEPVVKALTMMIVADVMATRVSSPGLEAETIVKPALDMADMLAEGDSPARWWVLSVLANLGAPYPDVPSDDGEAFDLVIGLVAVLLVTYTQKAAAQSRDRSDVHEVDMTELS